MNSTPEDEDWTGRGFVGRTLRSAVIVGGIVVFVLASYKQLWAILPFISGLALSSALLYAWDVFVRGLLTPESVRNAQKKGFNRKGTIIVFSLIKYPLVGLLLYMAVRLWRGDSYHALAFLGGFILLHVIIGLRAVSRALGTGKFKE